MNYTQLGGVGAESRPQYRRMTRNAPRTARSIYVPVITGEVQSSISMAGRPGSAFVSTSSSASSARTTRTGASNSRSISHAADSSAACSSSGPSVIESLAFGLEVLPVVGRGVALLADVGLAHEFADQVVGVALDRDLEGIVLPVGGDNDVDRLRVLDPGDLDDVADILTSVRDQPTAL